MRAVWTGTLAAVLFAVLGAFMLEVGGSSGQAGRRIPQAAFTWDDDSGSATITHQSGDHTDGPQLSVRRTTGNGPINESWAAYGIDEVITAPSTTVQNVTDASELRVIWESSDGQSSAIMGKWEGPEA